jgi:hypothetical protein
MSNSLELDAFLGSGSFPRYDLTVPLHGDGEPEPDASRRTKRLGDSSLAIVAEFAEHRDEPL